MQYFWKIFQKKEFDFEKLQEEKVFENVLIEELDEYFRKLIDLTGDKKEQR